MTERDANLVRAWRVIPSPDVRLRLDSTQLFPQIRRLSESKQNKKKKRCYLLFVSFAGVAADKASLSSRKRLSVFSVFQSLLSKVSKADGCDGWDGVCRELRRISSYCIKQTPIQQTVVRFDFPFQTFLEILISPSANPRTQRAAPSTWKSVAWMEIWVLRMLSRGSKSNTPIPSAQQQRDALLIICMPCNDSERETGIYEWVESSASILCCLEDNVLGGWAGRWEIRRADLPGRWLPATLIACKTMAKHDVVFTMPARSTCRHGLRERYDRNINSKTAAGLEGKRIRKSYGGFNAASGKLDGHYSRYT